MALITWAKVSRIYLNGLPLVYVTTMPVSIASGFINTIDHHKEQTNPYWPFFTLVGFVALGNVAAFTYPVSFPLLAMYVIQDKYKKDLNNKKKLN